MKEIKPTKPTVELILGDYHFPTEDPAVFDLTLQIARNLKPGILYLNGDIVDFNSISHFLTAPSKRLSISQDIKHARKQLQQLRKVCPNARLIFKEGNHELRLQKYLWTKAPELADLEEVELPSLLQLKQLEAEWVASDEKALVGRLYHLHGHEARCGYSFPAKAMLQRVNANVVFNHVHKFSVAHQNQLDGTVHIAQSLGCGQRLEVDYDFHPNWTQGFGIVEYTKSGIFHITPVEVFTDSGVKCVMVYGKLYRSRIG